MYLAFFYMQLIPIDILQILNLKCISVSAKTPFRGEIRKSLISFQIRH